LPIALSRLQSDQRNHEEEEKELGDGEDTSLSISAECSEASLASSNLVSAGKGACNEKPRNLDEATETRSGRGRGIGEESWYRVSSCGIRPAFSWIDGTDGFCDNGTIVGFSRGMFLGLAGCGACEEGASGCPHEVELLRSCHRLSHQLVLLRLRASHLVNVQLREIPHRGLARPRPHRVPANSIGSSRSSRGRRLPAAAVHPPADSLAQLSGCCRTPS
jgi:hypothetical protein